MRRSKVFIGSSHPELGKLICDHLGVSPAPCELRKFSNGETSIKIGASVRDEDVYIVQSGSADINDKFMELLILISSCRGGSANKITAVIPSFPYSKQSKMKKHRGAITARMLANLLTMAGADHIITMDLHASQMQGFFSKPVDNLYAGPTLAKWIQLNVPNYSDQVVIVSKNPGAAKRATGLADSLKVNFAMIHTDRKRRNARNNNNNSNKLQQNKSLTKAENTKNTSAPSKSTHTNEKEEDFTVHGMKTARIVQGHVVDDEEEEEEEDTKATTTSLTSSSSALIASPITHDDSAHPVNVTISEDEEEEEQYVAQEKLITLVGDVQGKIAILVDDMIDRSSSFIAAAEHCRINCGAKQVYIIASHGIFNDHSLESMEQSAHIDKIVVTNTYPIDEDKRQKSAKLEIIDVSAILSECIRRNHNGESISALFEQL
ncbi:phosphoribosyl pyrophosphokinase [Nadsonia fulvescens var. elongata DSM 6958]|uniref:Ribose-phosphate pyrophosphokinase 1 n=1 Tax=Nadsonia fulvescens var. elongata DSM 6958 TaxID=857566 RepID=A0A1E3PLD5_9ASCO|nr:phosphoribosyl pyrophosphokinase [Nadsonia fulvescens var. elongata DSM 6958]